jgi:hypothetical protein
LKIYNSPETVCACSAQARETVKEMLDVEGMLSKYGEVLNNLATNDLKDI